ncbi:MAG TPA: PAS domain-containing sensor histidine kinase [Ignavibacteriaceae bacterium]|nr:PAS domain-containing sensor histidine kinase [Ignavibacteriaceae bacterium]
MKPTKKESKIKIIKKVKKKIKPTPKEPVKKMEDVQRLLHLLQVHQIELEHQNQELRIAHEELEVSRFKYVNLFDFSPIPYFTLDQNGMIKEVNLSASKLLRIDRNKLIGRSFSAYVPLNEKDIFSSFIKTVFNSTEKHSCELKIINKEKHLFHLRLEGLMLDATLEPDPKCQVALIDLTEYKKIEDSLKETNEALKILNSTKDKFFSIIAHDLRRPFESLLGYSELLAKEIKSLSQEEIVLFSKGLNDNLKSLYGLLENLLNWSLMQRNVLEYKPENLNLYDLVNKIIGISNQSAMEKIISLSNNVDTRIFVYADVNMLRSVIQNLIINAIKFTQTGGQIIVSSNEIGGFVEVSVQDNGIGISSEKSSELFNFHAPFTTDGTAGEKGTGLGLPLCREFVERNEGKIWLDSELGKGSKFTFTLRKTFS